VRTFVSLIFAAVVLGSPAAGEEFPSRPITLVQGFAAGGNADTIARVVAQAMSENIGQRVVVEGKTGAGGNIASASVAAAKPDGYTLILLTGGHAVSANLYKQLAFKPVDGFQMISTVNFFPFAISVRADSPMKTLGDLIAAAKAKPTALSYSSVGVGSTQHLTGELLAQMAGIDMTHVPYRGGAAPLNDLLAGTIDVMMDTLTVSAPQIAAGKIRALAVTSPAPWPSLPDAPPAAATVPGFDVRSWTGVAAPAGVPLDVVAKLNASVRKGLEQAEVRTRLAALGTEIRGSTPEEMRAHVAGEIEKWRRVIETAKIERQE
jgi:tripartite-type tricarboxylate transporter receptor subunit TctC